MTFAPFMRGKKVLVTGSEGFIGSHLTERLVAAGAEVTAFVLYNSFGQCGWLDTLPEETRKALTIVKGDVRDRGSVMAATKGQDIVFHLAALIGIPYSYVAPQSYVDTNITGTLNVLEAARAYGVQRVLHTSTSEVYGSAITVPMSEHHPLNAQSPYAATKIAADQLALSYHRSFETPVCVVRPFNTYGPRQSTRAVIPAVICQIAQGKRKIDIGSLSPRRDFSYVSDTADGFLALAAADSALGEVVNLGSGFTISIGETIAMIADLMGVEVELNPAAERVRPDASEVTLLHADTAKAQSMTDWRPAYAGDNGFRAGLAKAIAWFTEPKNLAAYPTEYQV